MSLLKEYIKELLEAPIRDFETIGRKIDPEKPGSFGKKDKKLLSNERAIEKIKRKWEKTEYTFDMYLLNVAEFNKVDFREQGIVNSQFANQFKEITGKDIPNSSDSITILFNGNTGAEKVPLTAWMMAHRFGHAVQRLPAWSEYIDSVVTLTKDILEQVYGKTTLYFQKNGMINRNGWELGDQREAQEKMIRLFFNQLGSFKSARDGKIARYYEFFYELFAQYLMTGSVSFRPLEKEIVIATLPYGKKATARAFNDEEGLLDMWNRDLEIYANDIESRMINVLESSLGKSFLM